MNITFEFIIEIIKANVAYTPFLFCKLVFKFLEFLCLSLHVKCSSTCHPNANLSDPFVLHVLHKGFCNGELIFNSCNWQLAHIPTSLTSEPLISNMMMPQIVASYGLGSNLPMSCCIKFYRQTKNISKWKHLTFVVYIHEENQFTHIFLSCYRQQEHCSTQ